MVFSLKLHFFKHLINVRRHCPTLMQRKLSGCRSTELLGMMARSLQSR